jgi:hypothetical protein
MNSSRFNKFSLERYQQPIAEFLARAFRSVLASAAEGMRSCWRKPVALAITGVVPLLVVAGHRLAQARMAAQQPPHLREIIGELNSILIPTGKPVPNHAGTKLLYLRYSKDDTWGIYMFDMASKRSGLIDKIVRRPGAAEFAVSVRATILGWSPDDKYFACARSVNAEIVIYDAKSGKSLGNRAFNRSITSSAWLSSQKLVCSDGAQIYEICRAAKGWSSALFSEAPNKSNRTNLLALQNINSLTAFGPDSAVCQRINALCLCERGRAPKTIWQATNGTLLEFSYSKEAGKFLLHCKDSQGEFLADYYPAKKRDDQGVVTNLARLDTHEYHPQHVTLINEGKGCAYVNHNDVSLSKLIIKPSSSGPPARLPWQDEVRGFSISGLKLFATTASTNEPAGIWKYDLATGELELLVSSLPKPFKYASTAAVLEGYVTNTAGERLTYYLLQPTCSVKNQKHPLVVGIMGIEGKGYTWEPEEQTIASCGGYFVCMDRRNRDASQWGEDAFCAYEYLAKNLDVDTNKVYLLGVSAGAYVAEQLLKSKPDAWKGAILFSMHRFPAPDGIRAQTILLDIGGLTFPQHQGEAELLQSQEALAAAGIRPILTLHPGAGHFMRSILLQTARTKQLAAFIQQP